MDRAAEWIKRGNFCRIALQFPAGQISLAPEIIESLQQRIPINRDLFVLGDTSYGDCCVDEVGAEHYGADCVLHFGYSCQSKPLRLPTLCIFPDVEISRSELSSWVTECVSRGSPVLVLADPGCRDLEISTVAELAASLPVYLAPCSSELRPETKGRGFSRAAAVHWSGISRSVFAAASLSSAKLIFNRPLLKFTGNCLSPTDSLPEDTVVLFLGERNSPLLARAILSFPDKSVFCGEWISSGREIMRRFAGVEAIKNADRIGLLYAASALQGVTKLRDVLAKALRAMGKKVCGFCVGKLTDAKIGNFTEIECFVVLGCPDFLNNELLTADNLRNFHCPLISAFEAAVATDLLPWSGTIQYDFDSLSLPDDLIVPSVQDELIELTSRGYAGLEMNTLKTIPAEIEPGLAGIPSRYVSEPVQK